MAKAVDVAQKLIDIGDDTCNATMTQMKLLKLTYIAHGWMLGLTGAPLIDEQVQAWKLGPVIPELRNEIKHFKAALITDVPNSTRGVEFSARQENILAEVCDTYGKRDGIKLSEMTHMEGTPWHQIYIVNRKVNGIIPRWLIENYYKTLPIRARARKQS